jgi:hypothetical protein
MATRNNKTSRILGIAFLLQFITSLSSGMWLQPALIVPGNIRETMLRIAENPTLMRANVLVDMLTALGVIFLGAMLFATLREQDEKIALVGLGFYILEGALLAASRLEAFSLLRISQEYATAGNPAYLETMANLALESMDFVGFTLHVLVFCIGAILFYYLLYTSGVVPRILSLWGLITVLPLLVATVFDILDYPIPEIIALPYIPFEFVIGLWILVRGVSEARGSFAVHSPRTINQEG